MASMLNTVIEWVSAVLLLSGLYMITKKKRAGFFVASASETLWIVWALKNHAYGLATMSTAILLVYVHGIWFWGKTNTPETTEVYKPKDLPTGW